MHKKRKVWVAVCAMTAMLSFTGMGAWGIDAKAVEVTDSKGNTWNLVLDEEEIQIESSRQKKYGSIYASSYDPREQGSVTSVKEQGSTDTCWAFSTIAAMELAAVKQGLADNTIDLSENHLAYFFYHRENDPLGLTGKDRNSIKNMNDTYLSNGGSIWLASQSLATWSGAATEEVSPYLISNNGTVKENIPDASLAYANEWIAKNIYFLGDDEETVDVDEVKNAICSYGAVAAGYLHVASYYNSKTAAYCSPKTGGNHAVTIVGWDDNFSKENFASASNVKSDGAWIVKNSWGESWGEKGYFYISYEDKSISNMAAFQIQSPDTYQHNYQYDGSAITGYVAMEKDTKVANIFQAKGSKEGKDEIISAIGLTLWEPDVDYSIQIYGDLKDLSDPCSGTKLLTSEKKGKTSSAGILTLELGEDVTVANGEYYSVVVTLKKAGGTKVGIEYTYDSDWLEIQAQIDANQSFLYENGVWTDASKYTDENGQIYEICVRLKAFTNDAKTRSVSSISLNQKEAKLSKGQALQLSASILPQDISSNVKVQWSSSDTDVASVNQSGKVTAKKAGTARIQAVICDAAGEKKAWCMVTVEESNDLQKVTGWKASSTKAGQVDFSWNPQSKATGYDLYYKTSVNGKYVKFQRITSGKKCTFSKTNLRQGVKYYFKIKAYKISNGKTYYSENSKVIRLVVCIDKVTGLKSVSSDNGKIKLSWQKNKNASGYILYYASTKNGTYKKCKTITNKNKITYTKGNLKKGKTYYFKMRAYKTVDGKKYMSAFSKVLKVKCKK